MAAAAWLPAVLPSRLGRPVGHLSQPGSQVGVERGRLGREQGDEHVVGRLADGGGQVGVRRERLRVVVKVVQRDDGVDGVVDSRLDHRQRPRGDGRGRLGRRDGGVDDPVPGDHRVLVGRGDRGGAVAGHDHAAGERERERRAVGELGPAWRRRTPASGRCRPGPAADHDVGPGVAVDVVGPDVGRRRNNSGRRRRTAIASPRRRRRPGRSGPPPAPGPVMISHCPSSFRSAAAT